MSKLNGKIIVITGGTSGIGRHMAGEFCKNNTVVNLARSCGEETGGIRCDVSSEADVKAAFDIVRERYGRVDILINNAGYGVSGAAGAVVRQGSKQNLRGQFHGRVPLRQVRAAAHVRRR